MKKGNQQVTEEVRTMTDLLIYSRKKMDSALALKTKEV